jgi:hypothetical protein
MRLLKSGWLRTRDTMTAGAIAFLLVSALLACTGQTRPAHDGLHYLEMAQNGFTDNAGLSAPFAYRPAVPLLAGALARLAGIPAEEGFLAIALLSSWALLVVSYRTAKAFGSRPRSGLLIMSAVSLSFFTAKFHLAAPTRIDIEALFLLTAASLQILRQRYGWTLILSAVGLFFKEFLVIPGLVVVALRLREYVRSRSLDPLIDAMSGLCVLFVCFFLPRFLIPVTTGFGENLRLDLSEAPHTGYMQNLRFLLFARFEPEKLVNLVFSFASFWLPAILLVTPGRAAALRNRLAPHAFSASLLLTGVAALALIGGTNIMIFAAYSLPVLIIVLAAQLESEIHPLEAAAALGAVLIFNRIPTAITRASSPEEIMGFYGGWWSQVDGTTLLRTGEIVLAVVLLAVVRLTLNRTAKA